MSTSHDPHLESDTVPSSREPLRLRMGQDTGSDDLDGTWWPQSRELAVELADLADHFPPELGRIVRATVSPPDWDTSGRRRIPVADGHVRVRSSSSNDTHVIHLRTSERTLLRLAVVPPRWSDDQRAESVVTQAERRLHPVAPSSRSDVPGRIG